jgi:hypothetical protein
MVPVHDSIIIFLKGDINKPDSNLMCVSSTVIENQKTRKYPGGGE